VSYVLADEMQSYARIYQQLKAFLAKHEAIYLTLCLDVFASSYAPGVSAPQIMGITPTVIKPLLPLLRESGKVLSFDVAELAPNLDRDHMTAALAANLICLCLQ
jgi:formiminoglutamase